jgi:hypothetical protein
MSEEVVQRAFPELDAIEDDDLRTGVIDAWVTAIAENDIDDLTTVPWLPPVQRDLTLDDEYLVAHVRDVTACAVALAETLSEQRERDLSLDMDTVIAGALVHDVANSQSSTRWMRRQSTSFSDIPITAFTLSHGLPCRSNSRTSSSPIRVERRSNQR